MTNVTVSLSDELLREVRHLAVDEGMSLSRFVARSLEQRVDVLRAYRAARERQLRLLSQPAELSTHGSADWSRESLHER